MFVDILDFKSAIAVENILTPYKKGRLAQDKKTRLPKEKITPEICMEVLQSTNYARNIKDMLLCIAELPQAEQAAFRDVVLAAFYNREQPNDILVLGKKLAVANGFEEALSAAIYPQDGEFLLSGPRLLRGYRSPILNLEDEEVAKIDCFECSDVEFFAFDKNVLPSEMRFPFAKQVYFAHSSLENVKKMTFNPEATVYLDNESVLPQNLEVATCRYLVVPPEVLPVVQKWKVREGSLGFDGRQKKFSGELDLTAFGLVQLQRCDLKDVSRIRFREGAVAIMRDAKNLPSDMDFSALTKVDLGDCDLQNQTCPRFRDGAQAILKDAKNLPPNMDFSECVTVDLSGCDLKGQKLRFDEARQVYLEQAALGQTVLDFPKCEVLSLMGTSLLPKTKLYFPKAAEVNFSSVTNLPDDVDVSHCAQIRFRAVNLKNQPHLRFADGAEVDLQGALNIPKNVDFSRCARVNLSATDLKNCANLTFQEGAWVNLSEAQGLPERLDVSSCSYISLFGAGMTKVKWVCFKNKEQMRQSLWAPASGFLGKVCFSEDVSELESAQTESEQVKQTLLQKMKEKFRRS